MIDKSFQSFNLIKEIFKSPKYFDLCNLMEDFPEFSMEWIIDKEKTEESTRLIGTFKIITHIPEIKKTVRQNIEGLPDINVKFNKIVLHIEIMVEEVLRFAQINSDVGISNYYFDKNKNGMVIEVPIE